MPTHASHHTAISDNTTTNTTSDNTSIPSILQRIVATKHEEVAAAKAKLPLQTLKQQVQAQDITQRGFANALRQASLGIIAEIKKASPSKGIISQNFDPIKVAKQYQQAGATCLSVLTDQQYFQGADAYLQQAKSACDLPILRKDFMVDDYQIYQSYLLGADCILLIMACLDDSQVQQLHGLSVELGMDVLIEIHNHDELERALKLPISTHNLYGINNRDLNTFTVDLQTSIDLAKILANRLNTKLDGQLDTNIEPLIVTESGIHQPADIELMLSHNIRHFLIGEQFMKTDHPGQTLQSLLTDVTYYD